MADAELPSSERLLTPAEVAALVFVDPKTVSRWAERGRIASTRTPGGHRRFRMADVAPFLPKGQSVEHGIGTLEIRITAVAREARLARMTAAAEAAAGVADDAKIAAAAVESRSLARERRLEEAAEQARRLVLEPRADAGRPPAAVQVAEAVRAAADAASVETTLAAEQVARAVRVAAETVVRRLAEVERAVERQTAATAVILHQVAAGDAHGNADRHHVAVARAAAVRRRAERPASDSAAK